MDISRLQEVLSTGSTTQHALPDPCPLRHEPELASGMLCFDEGYWMCTDKLSAINQFLFLSLKSRNKHNPPCLTLLYPVSFQNVNNHAWHHYKSCPCNKYTVYCYVSVYSSLTSQKYTIAPASWTSKIVSINKTYSSVIPTPAHCQNGANLWRSHTKILYACLCRPSYMLHIIHPLFLILIIVT